LVIAKNELIQGRVIYTKQLDDLKFLPVVLLL